MATIFDNVPLVVYGMPPGRHHQPVCVGRNYRVGRGNLSRRGNLSTYMRETRN